MLAFLILADALPLNLRALRRRAWTVATLALIGTAVVGVAFWKMARVIGHLLPSAWVPVFDALISPTDPFAVVSTLKHVSMSQAAGTEMQGEALVNDGVCIGFFAVLVDHAAGDGELDAEGVALDLMREAGAASCSASPSAARPRRKWAPADLRPW